MSNVKLIQGRRHKGSATRATHERKEDLLHARTPALRAPTNVHPMQLAPAIADTMCHEWKLYIEVQQEQEGVQFTRSRKGQTWSSGLASMRAWHIVVEELSVRLALPLICTTSGEPQTLPEIHCNKDPIHTPCLHALGTLGT